MALVSKGIFISISSLKITLLSYTYLPLSPMIMILSLSKYFRFWCSCAAATAASKVRRKKGNDTPVICVLLSLEHYKSVYINVIVRQPLSLSTATVTGLLLSTNIQRLTITLTTNAWIQLEIRSRIQAMK